MKDGQMLHRVTTMYERQMRQLWAAQIQTAERVRKAVTPDGTINPAALRTTVRLPLTWTIAGAMAVGTNVAGPRYVPQDAKLKLLKADVQVAPIGSEATFALLVDGAERGRVTITAGTTSNVSPLNESVTAGQVLTLSALAVGSTTPAEDATVTLDYAPS